MPLLPADYFNRAIESFENGDLSEAVCALRSGFFENLYVAPILIGESFQRQPIWHSGPQAEPLAAQEYVSRYRSRWELNTQGLDFLKGVWHDPLVRNELKRYINLCKNLKQIRDKRQRSELLNERKGFMSLERIKGTQLEILKRASRSGLSAPEQPPFLGLVMLSATDPKASVEFYRRLFELEPIRVSEVAGGYAEFELAGVHIGIHGYNQQGDGDPYGLGPPPSSFGWGAFFVIRVSAFDRYYDNATKAGIDIIDCQLQNKGSRFFVVKDPSGYVIEITEEELQGFGGS